jgi:hypothetical protein
VTEFNCTLGSSFIGNQSFFYGNVRTWLKLRGRMNNSYYDSYAFNQPNTVAREQFGDLFGHFKRTVIRSRLSVIRAGARDSVNPDYLLHRDEPVYENIRINIPLTASPNHYLQYNGKDVNLKLGQAYTWDTNQPHRVHGVDHTDRIIKSSTNSRQWPFFRGLFPPSTRREFKQPRILSGVLILNCEGNGYVSLNHSLHPCVLVDFLNQIS